MICKHRGLQVTERYYKHISERVINVNNMWDILLITDQTILAYRPDKVLHDKKEKTCLLINIAIPDDLLAHTKETKKLSNYKDLEIKS
jgi:hypothetical protein